MGTAPRFAPMAASCVPETEYSVADCAAQPLSWRLGVPPARQIF